MLPQRRDEGLRRDYRPELDAPDDAVELYQEPPAQVATGRHTSGADEAKAMATGQAERIVEERGIGLAVSLLLLVAAITAPGAFDWRLLRPLRGSWTRHMERAPSGSSDHR